MRDHVNTRPVVHQPSKKIGRELLARPSKRCVVSFFTVLQKPSLTEVECELEFDCCLLHFPVGVHFASAMALKHGEMHLLGEIISDTKLHHEVVRITGSLQSYDAVAQLAVIEYKGGEEGG